ncbi:thioredoxin domain-containing protein [Fumia xinanensis]|uniref:Thioredoxin domain-containing protein n=1 Tax=Fumia xinanensis TaxID=2763659 RepID=A0A926I7S0_9FIRM|nr:thioredoxin domain-containing protein [Fumia xinanensis]MBC8560147.1 thioredoxin domain-containing protein [Fumia xinanensis]
MLKNHLKEETSPYLLQHADNPVDWYPWCDEAFKLAREKDLPVFLSIGYSTCHWCHVMAHESFEDPQIAEILNRNFISIKVDKEERPDIDSIYMTVCQALTGSGGWPTSIFMTPEQKPFFAGTYFPKTARYGTVGFGELLRAISEKWRTERQALLKSSEDIVSFLNRQAEEPGESDKNLLDSACELYQNSFDETYGGFGEAPKFPTPHNLLFLLTYYQKTGQAQALHMVEATLEQMHRGGLFDHIGYGFSRYSTDRYFLAPHFEKMLYDNGLLIMAYSKAYTVTQKEYYRDVAEKTASYILREMTDPDGGFYSAQDADSEGVEGKYYLFEPKEIISLLGKETGNAFCRFYDITEKGNFEGKSIPNLLGNPHPSNRFEQHLPQVYEYRKKRYRLHLDDKILTAWNGLMIAALSQLYRVTADATYLEAALNAQKFIEKNLCQGETLYVSYREGKTGQKGFLDDYAFYIFALVALYEATLDQSFLRKARRFCEKAEADFFDQEQGGFWLTGRENERLILRPKETYDGAVPSGNSVMAYNLVRLHLVTADRWFGDLAERQLSFLSGSARHYPAGYSMFLTALSDALDEPEKIVIAIGENGIPDGLSCKISLGAAVTVLDAPTEQYRLLDHQTTYYICRNRACLPPVNEI